MSSNFWIGISLIGLSILGMLYNILLGFDLARTTSLSPDLHLASAFLVYFLVLLGHGSLILSTKKALLTHERQKLLTQTEVSSELRLLYNQRQSSVWGSLVVIVIGLISMTTGTISHAGRMPLVHLFFGFCLLASSLYALSSWLKFNRKLRV